MVTRYGPPGPAFGVAGRCVVGRGAWISLSTGSRMLRAAVHSQLCRCEWFGAIRRGPCRETAPSSLSEGSSRAMFDSDSAEPISKVASGFRGGSLALPSFDTFV